MLPVPDEAAFWDSLFTHPDPWYYMSDYEQTKYRHTLELLPAGKIDSLLEIACAEGHFTLQLAERAGQILAVDISERALARARDRCRDLSNVRFAQHDISRGLPEGNFDVIICAEVLYYLRDRFALNR